MHMYTCLSVCKMRVCVCECLDILIYKHYKSNCLVMFTDNLHDTSEVLQEV